MKKLFIVLLIVFPALAIAQGHKGSVESCAPMKEGKVCYSDHVDMPELSKAELFNSISKWAKNQYGKDIFLSNATYNKTKGIVFVSSKVELLLNEKDKTIVKYKMYITCHDNAYDIEVKDITYQYDPHNSKDFKTYAAEDVIANDGKSNTIALIKDPKLFCNATFFFVENLFGDVFSAAEGE